MYFFCCVEKQLIINLPLILRACQDLSLLLGLEAEGVAVVSPVQNQ